MEFMIIGFITVAVLAAVSPLARTRRADSRDTHHS